jgi:hypothetical protein
MTFAELQALVDAKLNESPDSTKRNDAINDAVDTLWKELCRIDPETYLSLKPDTLALDADIVPFTDLSPDGYLKYSAVSELYGGIYEWDAAAYWDGLAQNELSGIKSLVVRNMKRQDKVTQYRTQDHGYTIWPDN